MLNFADVTTLQPPSEAPLPPHITLLALLNRFTAEERKRIRTSVDPRVQDLLFLLQNSKFVDLSREQTRQGLTYLEATGMIGPGRAEQIATAPIHQEERP
jgi:hypothetical protein